MSIVSPTYEAPSSPVNRSSGWRRLSQPHLPLQLDAITTMIKPAAAWTGRAVDLGPIDQIAPRCYMTSFFCFRTRPGIDKANLVRRLQRAVFLTVQEIPQLSTTVVPRPTLRDELELRYLEDTGAYFAFKDYTSEQYAAEWEHGTFDDLAHHHFPYERLERRTLMDRLNVVTSKGLAPGLMLQANLIPGGLILVSNLHHTVCDGVSSFTHWTVLAKHCRNTPELELRTPPIDYADRTTVIIPDMNASLADLPDWKLSESEEEFLNPTHYDPEKLAPLRCGIYFLSEDRLAKLRSAFTVEGQKMSPIEAVAAFLWRHVVRARKVDVRKYPEAKLSLTVNARGQMNEPAVTPTYWGNFCEPNAVARMPTANFSLPSEKFMPSAARRIRGAISNVNAPAVRRLAGLLAQLPKVTSLTWNVDRWPGPDMIIVCLNAIPYSSLDFGDDLGGSCEGLRIQIGDIEGKPDGRCLIYPPRKGDGQGVEVMLQYEASTLERLDADPEFTAVFSKRC